MSEPKNKRTAPGPSDDRHRRPAATPQPRARRQWPLLGLVAAIAAIGVAVAASTGGSGRSGGTVAPGETTSVAPLQSEPPWAPQLVGLEDRVRAAGFPPVGDESYHVHALLSIFLNGGPVPVPADIGIDRRARYMSALHTHTPDGVIHFEADDPAPFTIQQIFEIWGVDFTANRLGPYINDATNRVQVYVNGTEVADPVHHGIQDQDNIVVAFGTAGSFPTRPPADALAKA